MIRFWVITIAVVCFALAACSSADESEEEPRTLELSHLSDAELKNIQLYVVEGSAEAKAIKAELVERGFVEE